MAGIDDSLTEGNTTEYLSGQELAQAGTKARSTFISAQVIPSADEEDFEVHIEGAVNSPRGPVFTMIGKIDQDSDTKLCAYPISINCLYRFRHVSGVSCRVLMSG